MTFIPASISPLTVCHPIPRFPPVTTAYSPSLLTVAKRMKKILGYCKKLDFKKLVLPPKGLILSKPSSNMGMKPKISILMKIKMSINMFRRHPILFELYGREIGESKGAVKSKNIRSIDLYSRSQTEIFFSRLYINVVLKRQILPSQL